jgi:hypothetical protein
MPDFGTAVRNQASTVYHTTLKISGGIEVSSAYEKESIRSSQITPDTDLITLKSSSGFAQSGGIEMHGDRPV